MTAEPVNVAQWWTRFDDAQLDSLVDRAVRANKDLRLAEARIRQARAQRRVTASSASPSAAAPPRHRQVSRTIQGDRDQSHSVSFL